MKKRLDISVFEHDRLYVGQDGFKQHHLDALLRLNELHDGTYFQAIAKGIKFNQYVGVIQIDGLIIEINPKADKDDDDSKWKGVLIQMLKACKKIEPSSTGAANVKRQNMDLLEIYFEMYLKEVDQLLRRGLVKKYRKNTSNVKALKGKLDFAGNIRYNLVHKERFYTEHQVYDRNHLLHQVLYCALDIVEQFTRSTRLYDGCKRVMLNFPQVDRLVVSSQQIHRLQLDRKAGHYQTAVDLARLIILNYSPDIRKGKEKMLSLLFDMNQLWEEYILTILRKFFQDQDVEIIGQDSRAFWGNNTLKPDIVLKKDGKTYIIDTKWKRPQQKSASVEDLRQMYTYCRFWDAEKALLLYPGDSKGNVFKEFKTTDYSPVEGVHEPVKHQCKMGFVTVLNEEGQLDPDLAGRIYGMLFGVG